MNQLAWINGWQKNDYVEMKQHHFTVIDNYINRPIERILDIGCGLAFESRQFYKKYNTELYLIDGDYDDNKESQIRFSSWSSETNLKYYSKFDDLNSFFSNDGIKNYKLINCEDIQLSKAVKFDLICSYLSCGFHYPLETYKELILSHSTENTLLIFTLRKKQAHNCKIVKVLHEADKYITAHISFL